MIYSKFAAPSYDVQTAINMARSHQLEAEAVRLGLPPEQADPDATARAEVDHLTRLGATSAQAAFALINNAALPVVPLDRDALRPSTPEPLTTVQEVAAHWRGAMADGVGVPTGTLPSGMCLLALSGTPAALGRWFAEVGTEEVVKLEDDKVIDQRRVHRDPGAYTSVRWSPPPARPGIGAVTLGMASLQRSTDELMHGRSREVAERTAFVAWSCAVAWTAAPVEGEQPTSRRRLEVKSRKLAGGLEVLGDGAVLPQHLVAADGWTVNASAIPTAVTSATVPEWVVEAVGGRWVDERLVDGIWKPAARVRAA